MSEIECMISHNLENESICRLESGVIVYLQALYMYTKIHYTLHKNSIYNIHYTKIQPSPESYMLVLPVPSVYVDQRFKCCLYIFMQENREAIAMDDMGNLIMKIQENVEEQIFERSK